MQNIALGPTHLVRSLEEITFNKLHDNFVKK